MIDTRSGDDRVGPHGTFSADDAETIQARGTNGRCTIPADAIGLGLNVTALDATQPTFLTIWPEGTRPLASSLNPSPGEPPTPNAVTTPLSTTGTFAIYNRQGSVNVIVDVIGYHIAALEGAQSAILDFGNSSGGANIRSTYPVSPTRYVVEAADGGAAPESVPVDTAILNQLCGDVDGCKASLYMRSWDASNIGLLAGVGPHGVSLSALNATQTRFRTGNPIDSSVTTGVDNNGAVNHALQAYDCYFTDAEYLNGSGTDTAAGFNVLNWNSVYPATTMVCVLVIDD